VGDSWRLWHKDPCGLAQSATTFGPPHLRDAYIYKAASIIPDVTAGDLVSFFNTMPQYGQVSQYSVCGWDSKE
jgi:hypothetical protein